MNGKKETNRKKYEDFSTQTRDKVAFNVPENNNNNNNPIANEIRRQSRRSKIRFQLFECCRTIFWPH